MSSSSDSDVILYDVSNSPVFVEKVVISGVSRTRDFFLRRLLKDVVRANSFADLYLDTRAVKDLLEGLDVAKKVSVVIERGKRFDSSYVVKFHMSETNLAGIQAMGTVGKNQTYGVLGCGFLRNPVGIADNFRLTGDMSYLSSYLKSNWGMTNFNLLYRVPVITFGGLSFFNLGLSTIWDTFYWSNFRERGIGPFCEVNFASPFGDHVLRWAGIWRHVTGSRQTSFDVREHFGSSIKSSLSHTYTYDSRDSKGLATRGSLLTWKEEWAGLGGDVTFLKHSLEWQFFKTFFKSLTLQLSSSIGNVQNMNPKSNDIRINDRFFLGGAYTVRGFPINSLGPRSRGDALGGNCYAYVGGHLFPKLPFLREGLITKHIRPHFFITGGGVANLSTDITRDEMKRVAHDAFRCSCGVGLALHFNIFRLELNYLWPVRSFLGDGFESGLQLGGGINFL